MAQVKVRQHKCPECSANLDIPDDVESVRCKYCGNSLSIEHKRPPKKQAEVQPRTIYIPSGPPPAARFAMFVGPLIPLVILASVFWPRIKHLLPGLGNQLPAECGLNGEITIRDKTFTGAGALIKGDINCTVRIENSTLIGDTLIDGGMNLKVTIVHSTVTAKRRLIVAGANANIDVSGKSELRGEKGGFELGSNAVVHLDDSKLTSGGPALRADSNFSLEASGGSIVGSPAIDASGTVQRFEVDGTQITGAQKLKKR